LDIPSFSYVLLPKTPKPHSSDNLNLWHSSENLGRTPSSRKSSQITTSLEFAST